MILVCGASSLTYEMDNIINSFQIPSDYSASSAYEDYGANQAL